MTPDEKLREVEEKLDTLRSAIKISRRSDGSNRPLRSTQRLVENLYQDLLRWRESDVESTWSFRKASAPQ